MRFAIQFGVSSKGESPAKNPPSQTTLTRLALHAGVCTTDGRSLAQRVRRADDPVTRAHSDALLVPFAPSAIDLSNTRLPGIFCSQPWVPDTTLLGAGRPLDLACQ